MSSPVLSIIQEAIDVPLMDIENISKLIYSYTVYEELQPKQFLMIHFVDNYLGFQQKKGWQQFFIVLVNNEVQWLWTCPEKFREVPGRGSVREDLETMNINWLEKYANQGVLLAGIPCVKITKDQFFHYYKALAVVCHTQKRRNQISHWNVFEYPRITDRGGIFSQDLGYNVFIQDYTTGQNKPWEQVENILYSKYIDPFLKDHQKILPKVVEEEEPGW